VIANFEPRLPGRAKTPLEAAYERESPPRVVVEQPTITL